jgi:hypothetical protein
MPKNTICHSYHAEGCCNDRTYEALYFAISAPTHHPATIYQPIYLSLFLYVSGCCQQLTTYQLYLQNEENEVRPVLSHPSHARKVRKQPPKLSRSDLNPATRFPPAPSRPGLQSDRAYKTYWSDFRVHQLAHDCFHSVHRPSVLSRDYTGRVLVPAVAQRLQM